MKSISEIIGFGATFNPAPVLGPARPAQQNTPLDPNINNAMPAEFNRIFLSYCNSMHQWQRDVVRRLSTGEDIYIQAGTGKGKTLPIMCYWSNHILNLNTVGRNNNDVIGTVNNIVQNPESIRKILWLVPIRLLAVEIYNSFLNHFATIIAQATISYSHQFIIGANPDDYKIVNSNDPNDHSYQLYIKGDLINQRNQMTDAITNTVLGRRVHQNQPERSLIAARMDNWTPGNVEQALVTVAIYESALNLINNPRVLDNLDLIVFDEAHELTPKVIDDYEDRIVNKVQALYKICDTLQRRNTRCRIAFLTGTIHEDSAGNFCNYLNTEFGRRLHFAHEQGGNTATIQITADDSLNNKSTVTKRLVDAVNTKDWGNLFVLFSAKNINQYAELACAQLSPISLNQVQNRETEKFFYTGGDPLQRERDKFQPFISKDFGSDVAHINIGDANKIKDKFLRECVMRGFGFIYRGREETGNIMDENDKIIVADLFVKKKIFALLATDAVGIGVNLGVKSLYIPSIDKYTANWNELRKIPIAHLTQVANRAGRSATPVATIFTTSENLEYVTSATFAQTSDFENVPVIKLKNMTHSKTGTHLAILPFALAYANASCFARYVHNRGGNIMNNIITSIRNLFP